MIPHATAPISSLPSPCTDKVFRELFCGASSALLVDADGGEWDCAVACETRNDLRLQYTLRGQFHDFWDVAGVRAGDVLTFERNAAAAGPGRIVVGRFPQGQGLEDALEASGPGGGASEGPALPPLPPAPPRAPRSAALPRRDSSLSEVTTGAGALFPPQQRPAHPVPAPAHAPALAGGAASATSHPNRWADLPDGSAAKTVYKSTLAHQQCPVAGWLYRKLYGRLPADANAAPMTDPVLGADFAFEVNYVPAANVHYLGGRAFGVWLRQAGVRSGDQIRVWRDHAGVKLCRMGATGAEPPPEFACPPLVPISAAVVEYTPRAAAPGVGAPAPPSTGALAALNALAVAAGYAGQHGTPAIQAVLAAAAELREGGGGDGEALALRLTAAGVPLPPSPFLTNRKRRADREAGTPPKRSSPAGGDGSAAAAAAAAVAGPAGPPPPQMHHALQHLLRQFQAQQQQQQQQRQGGSSSLPPLPLPRPLATQPRPPLPALQPRAAHLIHNPAAQQPQQQQHPGGAAFGVITAALARHAWAPAEAAVLVQFRAKCGK